MDASECGLRLDENIYRELGVYSLPEGLRISVVVPVYNEKETVAEIIQRVRDVPIPKEIILVDDFSTDGTREIMAGLDPGDDLRIILQPFLLQCCPIIL